MKSHAVSARGPIGKTAPLGRGLLQTIKPYLFLLPMLVFAVGFVYYPFFQTFLHSVSVVNAKGQITGFAGLDNFASLFPGRSSKPPC